MLNLLESSALEVAVLVIACLLALYAAFALCKLVYLYVAVLRNRHLPENASLDSLCVEVAQLPDNGPPDDGSQLTCYGLPVRVALLVVAPAGRHGTVPEASQLPLIFEEVVPGLTEFTARDHPRIDRWPPQLSSQGFAKAFFTCIRLPDDRGKGTPWCSIVGRVESIEQTYLIGMVLCASRPNSLGEMEVRKAGLWLDVLRVRS